MYKENKLMLRNNTKIFTFILLVVHLFIAIGCAGIDNKTETLSTSEAEMVIQQIVAGKTTYAEVKELIGIDGTDIGSGAIIYEWNVEGGGALRIWFNPPEGSAGVDFTVPDDLIVVTSDIYLPQPEQTT
jgi:hypothetical protein